MDKRKLFLLGIIAAVIGIWLYFDLSQYFTLEQAKAQQLALQDTIQTHFLCQYYWCNPCVLIQSLYFTRLGTN